MAVPEKNQKEIHSLGVPLSLQNDGFSCVPHCLKMILKYLNQKHSQVVLPTLEEIMQAIGTTELGTEYDAIENINKLVEKSIPSVEFKRDSTYPQWESVVEDLGDEKPVMLWIECKDQIGHPYGHSVVADGYLNNKVLYKDPLHGEVEEGIDTFLSKWDAMDRYTIRVKVGEKSERKITEFMSGGA